MCLNVCIQLSRVVCTAADGERKEKKRRFHTCSAPPGFIKTQRQIRQCSPWSHRFLRAFPAETGLRCTLMFPNTAHERRGCSRSRRLRLLAHVSAGKEAVIPTLNLAPAYWLLQSIDNSSRKEGGREGGSLRGGAWKRKFISLYLSASLPRSSALYTHSHIEYAEPGLALGHYSCTVDP